MTSKEQIEAIQLLTQSHEKALLPYPTAEKIIAEVMKNGTQAREAVMLMLLEYLTEILKSRESGIGQLREALGKTNPTPLG